MRFPSWCGCVYLLASNGCFYTIVGSDPECTGNTCGVPRQTYRSSTAGLALIQSKTVTEVKEVHDEDYEEDDVEPQDKIHEAEVHDEIIAGATIVSSPKCNCTDFCADLASSAPSESFWQRLLHWLASWFVFSERTPSWELPGSKYSVSEGGTNLCPDGSDQLETAKACQEAAATLGLTWSKEFNSTIYPPFCSKSGTWVYFNNQTVGGTAGAYSIVCLRDYPIPDCNGVCDCAMLMPGSVAPHISPGGNAAEGHEGQVLPLPRDAHDSHQRDTNDPSQ